MFEFAAIWVLLFLPLPLLIYKLLPAAKVYQAALKVPFYQDVANLNKTPTTPLQATSKLAIGILFLTWCLFVVAAAGPRWMGEPIPISKSGRDLLLAVDLSGSMQIPDMEINGKKIDRLQAIKYVASDFITKRKGDRLGLVLFGSKAYLQTPLTFDHQTIQYMLDDTNIGLAGPQTAIGDAIGLSIKRLLDKPEQSRVIILLTDGADNSSTADPIEAAKLAAKYGIKIYTIGFGADSLSVPGIFGTEVINPSADLDEKTLSEIAKLTGAKYFRANDIASLKQIYAELNKLEPISNEEIFFRPSTELYPWPLGLALLICSVICFSKLIRNMRMLKTFNLHKVAS